MKVTETLTNWLLKEISADHPTTKSTGGSQTIGDISGENASIEQNQYDNSVTYKIEGEDPKTLRGLVGVILVIVMCIMSYWVIRTVVNVTPIVVTEAQVKQNIDANKVRLIEDRDQLLAELENISDHETNNSFITLKKKVDQLNSQISKLIIYSENIDQYQKLLLIDPLYDTKGIRYSFLKHKFYKIDEINRSLVRGDVSNNDWSEVYQELNAILEEAKRSRDVEYFAHLAFEIGQVFEAKTEFSTALNYYNLAVSAQPDNYKYIKGAHITAIESGSVGAADMYGASRMAILEKTYSPHTLKWFEAQVDFIASMIEFADLKPEGEALALIPKVQKICDTIEYNAIKFPLVLAQCKTYLATVIERYGDGTKEDLIAKIESLYISALTLRKTNNKGLETLGVAQSLNNLGQFYSQIGKLDEAEGLYKKSRSIRQELFSNNLHNSALGTIENNIGSLNRKIGDRFVRNKEIMKAVNKYNEAEQSYIRSHSARLKALGSSHPALAVVRNNQAVLKTRYAILAKPQDKKEILDESAIYAEESLAIFLRAYGELHPRTGRSYTNLGAIQLKLGNPQKAYYNLRKGMVIQRYYSDPLNINFLNSKVKLGLAIISIPPSERTEEMRLKLAKLRSNFSEAYPVIRDKRHLINLSNEMKTVIG